MSVKRYFPLVVLGLFTATACFAMQDGSQALPNGSACSSASFPRVLRFTGALREQSGEPRRTAAFVRFALYAEQTGDAFLWQEQRIVQPNALGRYEVVLGCAAGQEFPVEAFAKGEARWLGVQVLDELEGEQPRVMLVSVPYALKAQDAETLGGLPASAFALAGPHPAVAKGQPPRQASAVESEGTVVTTVAHTTNAIPKFSATDTLADSLMMELYNQPALDAFGFILPNEDVVRLGDGSGLPKRLQIAGRMVSEGFDINTSAANSVHIVNSNINGAAVQANMDGTGFTAGVRASTRSFNGTGIIANALPPLSGSPNPGDYAAGIFASNYNQAGPAIVAFQAYNGLGGDSEPVVEETAGLYASVSHSTGIPAIFDQRAGSGQILSARTNGTEVVSMTTTGDITTAGTVTATSFSGSGAALTGVTSSSVSCSSCVSSGELDFDPATQAELNTHKSSSDHDSRYLQLTGGSLSGTLSGTKASFAYIDGVLGNPMIQLNGQGGGGTGIRADMSFNGIEVTAGWYGVYSVVNIGAGNSGAGVHGETTAGGTLDVGVRGKSPNGSGVHGISTGGGVGVKGSAPNGGIGVLGDGPQIGVKGQGVTGVHAVGGTYTSTALLAEVSTNDSTAAVLSSSAGGPLLSGRGNGGVEKIAIDSSGRISVYNGNSTVSNGISASLASVSVTGQTAAIGSSTILTAPETGFYRVSVYHLITTAGTGGTIATNIGWNDGSFGQGTGTGISAASAGARNNQTFPIWVSGGTNITYSTTFTSVTGSPAYSLMILVEKM